MVRKFFVERQRLPVGLHRQGRAAGGVHTQANNLAGIEPAHILPGFGEDFFNGDFRAFDVVGGMLPRQVRVARQNHTRIAVGVSPDSGGDFRSVGDVDDEGANGTGAVIEADRVFRAHERTPGLLVMVDFPAEIFDQGFLHPGGNARRVDGDVMFEAVFTNVAEELL